MPDCHTGAEAVYVSFRTVWSAIHLAADIQAQAWEVRRPNRNEDPIPSRKLRLSEAEADESGPCDVGPDLAKKPHTLTARATNHCAISSAMSHHSTKPALRKPSANFSALAGSRNGSRPI